MADSNNMVSAPPKVDKITTERIVKLCDFILVNADVFDIEGCQKYIEEHIDNNIIFCGDRYGIRSIVQKRIAKYIKECPSLAQLFTFKSDNNFQRFRSNFHEYYYYYYYTVQGRPSSLVYPIEFEYVFDAIQESIDFYVLYEQFSFKLEEEAVKRATEEATFASQKAVSDAKLAAKNAENAANEAANKAVDSVIEQVVEKKRLEEKITNSVDEQMNRVTSKVSETSVTILGIFSGIVLTFVAGFFYSSSVLESINAASFYKLMCVSSLVGLICLHLIVALFRFIAQIGEHNKNKGSADDSKKFFSDKIIIFISIVLIIIMIVSFWLQIKYPIQSTAVDSEIPDIDANIDVNISNNDCNLDDTTEESSSAGSSTSSVPDESAPTTETSDLNDLE